MSIPISSNQKLNGNIDDTFLPGLFYQLHCKPFTGTVQFRDGPTGKAVYFREGGILSASSNHETDRLSTILLRDSFLTTEQLKMAKEKLRPGTSLGRSLVELGFVSRNQLMETARNQVRGILQSLFNWETGQYEILEDQIPPSVPELGMETARLLFDTFTTSTNRPAVLKNLGGMERKLRRAPDFHVRWKKLPLGEEAGAVFSLVDPRLRAVDICNESPLDDFVIAKILCAGLHLGLLEEVPVPPAVAPAAPGKTPETPVTPPRKVEIRASAPPIPPVTPNGENPPAITRMTGRKPLAPPPKKPFGSDPEGPFHGYVDTSPGKSGVGPPGPKGGGGSSRPKWIALGGIFVALALGIFGVLLLTTGGTSESGVVEDQPPVLVDLADTTPSPRLEEKEGMEVHREPEPAAPIDQPSATPPARAQSSPPDPLESPPTQPQPDPVLPPKTEPRLPDLSAGGARHSLASGDFQGAAEQFRALLFEEPKGSYTLQLMVACRTESLSGMMPPPEGLAILPIRLGDRDCFRVCWGTFPDQGTALQARKNLPDRLPKLSDLPLPIAISRVLGAKAGSAGKRP